MKDMKETDVTKFSLDKTNEIISKMESHSFHNHFHILYDLCDHFTNDITYLEIGCFGGASASLVSSHPSVKKIFSIDLGRPIKKNIAKNNVSKFKHKFCEYIYFEGNSRDYSIVSKVKEIVNTVDILYIDGDHSYTGVLSDFNNYSELVNLNGYIVFDDYLDFQHSPEVKNAVDFIIKNIDQKKYEIIGSLYYELISKTNLPNFESSNLFLLKKIK
jgi:predicted O-methyltransferase YrrM